MRLVAEHPDLELVLLDLGLPDVDGFVMLKELRDRYPSLPIVVLSALQDRNSVTRALDLGALGFIPKSAQRAVMLGALQLVFAGGIYVPPEILRREETAAKVEQSTGDGRPPSPVDLGLTERQMQVLALMLRGKSNKSIGRALDLSEPTVKNHVTAILRALRVTSRAEVSRYGSNLTMFQKLRQGGSQRHRAYRLVHQMVTERANLAQSLRSRVSTYEKGWYGHPKVAA
jgi:DNA-binding NarL/FixJ family response regulator